MHHKRFDGKGYPIGKAGADIPIGERIIAICDSIVGIDVLDNWDEITSVVNR